MKKNKKHRRLTESDLHRIVKGVVSRTLHENQEYEALYDRIQDVTNDIVNYCGLSRLDGANIDDYTQRLMDRLSETASKMSEIAHELEEHLAWDEIK